MSYKDQNKRREYARLWIAKRRADFFANKSCIKCKSKEKLELDHINPSTKISHNIWSWSEERRLAEIKKCQVFCYACHQIKTMKQDRKQTEHGKIAMYRHYGCRCELCKVAKLQDSRRCSEKRKLNRKINVPMC